MQYSTSSNTLLELCKDSRLATGATEELARGRCNFMAKAEITLRLDARLVEAVDAFRQAVGLEFTETVVELAVARYIEERVERARTILREPGGIELQPGERRLLEGLAAIRLPLSTSEDTSPARGAG